MFNGDSTSISDFLSITEQQYVHKLLIVKFLVWLPVWWQDCTVGFTRTYLSSRVTLVYDALMTRQEFV